jgi:hypothetical protein
MVASDESQMRMFVVHAKYQGGCYLVLVRSS